MSINSIPGAEAKAVPPPQSMRQRRSSKAQARTFMCIVCVRACVRVHVMRRHMHTRVRATVWP